MAGLEIQTDEFSYDELLTKVEINFSCVFYLMPDINIHVDLSAGLLQFII